MGESFSHSLILYIFNFFHLHGHRLSPASFIRYMSWHLHGGGSVPRRGTAKRYLSTPDGNGIKLIIASSLQSMENIFFTTGRSSLTPNYKDCDRIEDIAHIFQLRLQSSYRFWPRCMKDEEALRPIGDCNFIKVWCPISVIQKVLETQQT